MEPGTETPTTSKYIQCTEWGEPLRGGAAGLGVLRGGRLLRLTLAFAL